MLLRRGVAAVDPSSYPWYCGLFVPLSLITPDCMEYEKQAAQTGGETLGKQSAAVAGAAVGGILQGAGEGFKEGLQFSSGSGSDSGLILISLAVAVGAVFLVAVKRR